MIKIILPISLIFLTGCSTIIVAMKDLEPLTESEKAYVISKYEPPKECKSVGYWYGYESECKNPLGGVPDEMQFTCIRQEITKDGGNYGVIDAVIGNGWYKGRTFSCPNT